MIKVVVDHLSYPGRTHTTFISLLRLRPKTSFLTSTRLKPEFFAASVFTDEERTMEDPGRIRPMGVRD